MTSAECLPASPPPLQEQIEQIETRLRGQLMGRVRDLTLELKHEGVVLRGHVRTYYAKQLAQHAVMRATDVPILANEIQVS